MEYKSCVKCGEVKDESGFAEKRTVCRVCRGNQAKARAKANPEITRAKRRAHIEKNREEINATTRAWKLKNPDKVKEYRSKFYEENKEKVIADNLKWREANQEFVREMRSAYYQKHKELWATRGKEYYAANIDRIKEQSAKYRSRTKKQKALADSNWRRNNVDVVRAAKAKRRAAKLLATPVWADKVKIVSFYTSSDALGMLTGDWYHVDHIVPLKSKFVCGLHCEANLQILPASENMSKSNRWWPNMW
jgi:hypothetical protein